MSKKIGQQFTRWIHQQTKRPDPVGDLAKDIQGDNSWPNNPASIYTFRGHLIRRNACPEAIQALEDAWSEFLLSTAPGPEEAGQMNLTMLAVAFRDAVLLHVAPSTDFAEAARHLHACTGADVATCAGALKAVGLPESHWPLVQVPAERGAGYWPAEQADREALAAAADLALIASES